jgi:ketosteroid isomerase-like protein
VTPSERNIDLVRRVYDGFSQGDLRVALEPLADDIEWHEAGALWGGVYRGGEAILQNVFGPALADIPDLAVTPEQFMTSGDTVVVLHRYTGTGKATGKKLNLLRRRRLGAPCGQDPALPAARKHHGDRRGRESISAPRARGCGCEFALTSNSSARDLLPRSETSFSRWGDDGDAVGLDPLSHDQ